MISTDILHSVLILKGDDLYWKIRPVEMFSHCKIPSVACNSWNARLAGKRAFTHVGNHGYREGAIFNKLYLFHRVVWAMRNGKWPVFSAGACRIIEPSSGNVITGNDLPDAFNVPNATAANEANTISANRIRYRRPGGSAS